MNTNLLNKRIKDFLQKTSRYQVSIRKTRNGGNGKLYYDAIARDLIGHDSMSQLCKSYNEAVSMCMSWLNQVERQRKDRERLELKRDYISNILNNLDSKELNQIERTARALQKYKDKIYN